MSKASAGPARYPIRAVSKLTGIGIDTLRAWERRYSAVTPARDDRGRMYTDADVARLRLLQGAVMRGHSIGRVAALGDEQLRPLIAAVEPAGVPATDPSRPMSLDTAMLVAALRAYDPAGIDRELARLAAVLRPIELLQDVVMPVLAQVGDDWYRRRATIAHEHMLSSAVRTLLGSFVRLYASPDAPVRLLFATPAGERHELGTLGAALLAASSGLGVAYIGPDVPARDIIASVGPAGAKVIVLGITALPNGNTKPREHRAQERELRAIVRDLPQDVELWGGGRGAQRYASIIAPRGLVLRDYQTYQQELIRIGGRAR